MARQGDHAIVVRTRALAGRARVTARKATPPPLDALAEALVLADPADLASLETLDARVAALARWVSRAGAAGFEKPVHELQQAVRALRLDPESGQRALEGIGARFCAIDGALGSGREGITESAPAAPEEQSDRRRGSDAAPTPDAIAAAAAAPELSQDAELVADFVTRGLEHLENAEEQLILLEKSPGDREALNATFRAFHTIKGMAGFLALNDIQSMAHATESILDAPRHGHEALGPAAIHQLFAAIDALRTLVARVGGETTVAPVEVPESDLPQPVETGEDLAYGRRSDDWRPDSVAPQAAVTRTVRVDEERLDRLVDAIGELVIAESMVSEASKEIGGGWTVLSQQFSQLDKITRNLQEMATSLRMVPLKSTFRRMSRVARDMSQSAGKPVEFELSGEETELDKEMVDRIADPLTHLLRNAIDHGLESPEERAAAGKPAQGRVELRAYHRGGTINIEVSDDGKGIELASVVSSAKARGIVVAEQQLSDREALQLIFEPGLSTKQTITEISGRGVGMDVVKRVVESLRGHVEIASEVGVGTRFTIRLPLTLAIIEGMVLRVATERYVLPLTAIERSVRPTPGQLVTALGGRAEMLDVDDGLIPIVRLDRLFSIEGAEQDPGQAVVVIVNEGGHRAGLLACELMGQQQTVIKPLGDALRDMPGLTGAAIMPDGLVGLILDAAGLVELANQREGGVTEQ